MSETFTTKTGEFEGPLELLLNLIEKRKLHINQISLAQVADDYIQHLKEASITSKNNMANFLIIASTLILIKSIALLPTLEITAEEKSDTSDLEYRLKLYEFFKSKADSINILWKNKAKIFFREGTYNNLKVFSPAQDATIDNLSSAVKSVITNAPKKEKLSEVVVKKVISLEEVIEGLTKRIQTAVNLRFSDFAKTNGGDRVGIIVSFLGMLELVKQGIISVRQDNTYGDISMENNSIQVPRYE